MAIKGGAGGPLGNGIEIEQPGATDGYDQTDRSDYFSLMDSQMQLVAKTQRQIGSEDMYDKWKLGVGIGVGIGVPAFMSAAFAVGFFLGKGRGKK